tara:strand:- start:5501 stop:8032 length:2532 start_codon:yes stop_codon:yes gene_type:complete
MIIRHSILLLLAFTTALPAFSANRDFHTNTGKAINGDVIKYFEDGTILLKRSKDNQLFRIDLSIFTQDDQAFVKNNFPPNHDSLPEFNRPLSDRDLTINSQYIDNLVLTHLRKYNQRPNDMASDETFLRRTYLKIIGRIPTLEEGREFLEDRDRSTKRRKLVDKLLASEGFNSNWFHFWADILRAKERINNNRAGGGAFIDYIKESIASNKPYDKWVKEMLSSTGPLWQEGNGAVGYYARDAGMPLDNMSNTVRIFLGTSLECAQCHDHPFDRWTQKQFYEMAAYTNGMGRVERKDAPHIKEMNKLVRDEQRKWEKTDNPENARKLRDAHRGISDLLKVGLDDLGKGSIKLPDDYQYDNAVPGQELKAQTIFGLAITLDENLEKQGSRVSYATWLASPANPRFSNVIANRLWKKTFGIGLIEPVDNMFDDTMPTNPELMLHLEKLMVALNYDLKEFLRILYNTKAFQRKAVARDVMARDAKDETMPPEVKWVVAGPHPSNPKRLSVPFFYQGPVLERMTAEQLWDSLLTLNYPEIEKRKAVQRIDNHEKFARYDAMSGEELFAEIIKLAGVGGGGVGMEDGAMAGVAKPRAKLGNPINTNCPIKPGRAVDPSIKALNEKGETIGFCCNGCKNKFVSSMSNEKPATKKKVAKLGNPINTDCPLKPGRAIDPSLLALNEDGETIGFCCKGCLRKFEASMAQARNKKPSDTPSMDGYVMVKNREVRASEIGSPAPVGHFIREFGGADREQIENSHKQAAVTQVLNLLNGYVETKIFKNKESVVMKNVNGGVTMEEKIELAFRTILNRKPNTAEIRDFKDAIKKTGDTGYKDLVWVLVNSHEFMFVQ